MAAKANVSESTVTRVLNGGYVSEEVRHRVLALVDELGYVPNALAQGLRTRRTHQVACVVLSVDNPFYSQVMLGVEEVANRHGYVLTMYSSATVEKNPGAFFTGRHDGIILLSIDQKKILEQLDGVKVPIVAYSDFGPHPSLPSVGVDLQPSVDEVVHYLANMGHHQIGYIGTEDAEKDRNPRLAGFYSGVRSCELELNPRKQVQFVQGFGTMESGYTAMADLYGKFPELTAVVAMNDLLAFGAVRWMRDHGLHVPSDVSIVGCDDITYCSMANPRLSTIQIPKRKIGNHLMDMLIRQIEGDMSGDTAIQLPTSLTTRASAANVRVL